MTRYVESNGLWVPNYTVGDGLGTRIARGLWKLGFKQKPGCGCARRQRRLDGPRPISGGMAAPDGQEDICLDGNVFFCENWASYAPHAFGSGEVLNSHYKANAWATTFGNQGSIVNVVGPTGAAQNVLQFHYSPTVNQGGGSGGDGGAGGMDATMPAFPSEFYLRFYAKFESYVWSFVSTKHVHMIADFNGGNETFFGTGHFDGSAGSPPPTFSHLLMQHSGPNSTSPAYPSGSPVFFQNDVSRTTSSVAGFANNRWYYIEGHMRYNTPGQSNGLAEMWIDDGLGGAPVRVLNYPGVVLDSVNQAFAATIRIATTWNCSGTFNGGNGCQPSTHPEDVHGHMWRYTANMVASTARIGQIGGGGGGGDVTNPVVSITGPTSNPSYLTKTSPL